MKYLFVLFALFTSVALFAQADTVERLIVSERKLKESGVFRMTSKLPKDKYVDAINQVYWDLLDQESTVQTVYKYRSLKKVVPETQENYIRTRPTIFVMRGEDDHWLFQIEPESAFKPGSVSLPGFAAYTASTPVLTFFCKGNELLYFELNYTNSTRMGSCGTVSIQYRAYFKEEALYQKEVIQEPFDCYGDKVNEEEIQDDFEFWLGILDQLD